jgi:hypothetical protein
MLFIKNEMEAALQGKRVDTLLLQQQMAAARASLLMENKKRKCCEYSF